MGLLENYSGIGMSPRPKWQHQNVIFRWIGTSYNEMRRQRYVMLPEATITDDWNDKAPDLVVFDESYHPLSIIEITRTEQLDAIIDKCEELMERFVRGDSSRNTEGSGLGLSIARSLTELMDGQMSVSVDGDLFKVTLTFPTV